MHAPFTHIPFVPHQFKHDFTEQNVVLSGQFNVPKGEFIVVLKNGTRLSSSRRYRQNLDALLKS